MKILKRSLIAMTVLTLLLSLSACGGEASNGVNVTPTAIATADWAKATFHVLGAETTEDSYGDSVIRLYYEYTNLSDTPDSAFNAVRMDVTQNGETLEEAFTYADDIAPLQGNELLNVQTNAKVRAVSEFLTVDDSKVSVRLYDYDEEEADVTFELDLSALPGKPDTSFAFNAILDPKHTVGAPSSAVYEENYEISIDGVETFEEDGQQLARVHFTFTNRSDEAENMWFVTNMCVYQDGFELRRAYPEATADSDENYESDTDAGATAKVSVCYELRTVSPIEVAFYEFDEVVIGAKLNVG